MSGVGKAANRVSPQNATGLSCIETTALEPERGKQVLIEVRADVLRARNYVHFVRNTVY